MGIKGKDGIGTHAHAIARIVIEHVGLTGSKGQSVVECGHLLALTLCHAPVGLARESRQGIAHRIAPSSAGLLVRGKVNHVFQAIGSIGGQCHGGFIAVGSLHCNHHIILQGISHNNSHLAVVHFCCNHLAGFTP